MRWALALLLASLVLAGCSAGDDPSSPPNADPYPKESYPPVANATATSTPSGSITPSTSATATATTTPTAHGSFTAQDKEDTDDDAEFPALMLGGHLTTSATQAKVEATANNVGERPYRVPTGCGTPWSDSVTGPSGTVTIRPAPAPCTPTYGALAAHDFLSHSFTWEGTVWDGSAYHPAPAGTYTWHVAFDVYDGDGTPPPMHGVLAMDFQVTVK